MNISSTDFLRRVAMGNLNEVRIALAAGIDVKIRGRTYKPKMQRDLQEDLIVAQNEGNTSLYLAVKNDHLQVAEALLKNCPSLIDESCFANRTALFVATKTCIPLLLENGINIYQRSDEDWTALLYMIKACNIVGVTLLLQKAHQTDESISSCLKDITQLPSVIYSLIRQYSEFETLFDFVNIKTRCGLTPLKCAVDKNQINVHEIKENPEKYQDYNGIVKLLIDAKARVNVTIGKEKKTLIECAKGSDLLAPDIQLLLQESYKKETRT